MCQAPPWNSMPYFKPIFLRLPSSLLPFYALALELDTNYNFQLNEPQNLWYFKFWILLNQIFKFAVLTACSLHHQVKKRLSKCVQFLHCTYLDVIAILLLFFHWDHICPLIISMIKVQCNPALLQNSSLSY